jgi:hypothetical protein
MELLELQTLSHIGHVADKAGHQSGRRFPIEGPRHPENSPRVSRLCQALAFEHTLS